MRRYEVALSGHKLTHPILAACRGFLNKYFLNRLRGTRKPAQAHVAYFAIILLKKCRGGRSELPVLPSKLRAHPFDLFSIPYCLRTIYTPKHRFQHHAQHHGKLA